MKYKGCIIEEAYHGYQWYDTDDPESGSGYEDTSDQCIDAIDNYRTSCCGDPLTEESGYRCKTCGENC